MRKFKGALSLERARRNWTLAAAMRPAKVHLLHECHAIFSDLQGRLRGGAINRSALLKERAVRLRAACAAACRELETSLVAQGGADPDDDAAAAEAADVAGEVEDLKTAHALLMAAEVSFLDFSVEGGGLEARPPPALPFLEFLRANFVQATTESMLTGVLRALRGPAAVSNPAIASDVWDLSAKLVVEGEPHDAGKLLALLGTASRSREIAAFADLLCAFPLLSSAAAAGGAAYGAGWGAWKAATTAFLRGAEGERFAPLTPGAPGFNAVWHSLLVVLTGGDAWTALAAIRVRPLSAVWSGAETPFARWFTLATVTVLYGLLPATDYGRAGLVRTLKACLNVGGMDLDEGVMVGGAEGLSGLDPGSLTASHLLACLVRTFEGDATVAVELLPLYDAPWAAAHLTDLLWLGGMLQAAPAPALKWQPASPEALLRACEGKDVPMRAAWLCAYAQSLPASDATLALPAIRYAYAATPDAVLHSCGIPERVLRQALSSSAGKSLPLAVLLARADGSLLTPELRAAKLAVLTGSASGAHAVTQRLLTDAVTSAIASLDEAGVECLVGLALTLRYTSLAATLCRSWAQACLDESRLGSALLWFLKAHGHDGSQEGLETWAKRALSRLSAAIDAAVPSLSSDHCLSDPFARTQALCASPTVTALISALGCIGHEAPAVPTDGASVQSASSLSMSPLVCAKAAVSAPLTELLCTLRVLECWRVGYASGAAKATASHQPQAFGVTPPAFYAFSSSVPCILQLAGEGSSYATASRTLRLATACGLFYVRAGPGARPVLAVEEGLQLARRVSQEQLTRSEQLSALAARALAGFSGKEGGAAVPEAAPAPGSLSADEEEAVRAVLAGFLTDAKQAEKQ